MVVCSQPQFLDDGTRNHHMPLNSGPRIRIAFGGINYGVTASRLSPKRFAPNMHKELQTAIAAVVRASRLTQKIFTSGNSSSAATITKIDRSPVTIADYGSQAIVSAMIRSAFPNDPIVGEENAEELQKNPGLRDKVWRLVSSTLQETPPDELAANSGSIDSPDDMMNLIDRGNSPGGSVGRKIACSTSLILRLLDPGSY